LLKRRQIHSSRPCAIATAHLLRRVVGAFQVTDVAKLIQRVQQVGQRLVTAQPKELAVGNIVLRVLGVIRDEVEENRDGDGGRYCNAENASQPGISRSMSKDALESIWSAGIIELLTTRKANERPPLPTLHTSYVATTTNAPAISSLSSLLPHSLSKTISSSETADTKSPGHPSASKVPGQTVFQDAQELRAEVVEGIQEIIDELGQADDQIAGYALDHIHASEVVLTHTPSITVQNFFLRAATKRKFTVIHVETSRLEQQLTSTGLSPDTGHYDDETSPVRFHQALTVAGVAVIVVPFSAVFALMSRVSRVIVDTHVVLADGGLVAMAGAKAIALAARMHRTPVVVLSGIYKLSPVYALDTEGPVEFGDPTRLSALAGRGLTKENGVENPLYDYVPPDLVNLYLTNLSVPT
ncbi:MAG: hypothetical protein LQ345_004280, partial [Seirophora villosa]